jgi:peptidoglycan hydrolase-like protein with peptidoglycan-binding domain
MDGRSAITAVNGDRATRIQLLSDLNRTAGNAAAGAFLRSASTRPLQREPSEDDPYADETETPAGLTNARFTPHARLKDIAGGGAPLGNRDPAAAIKATQTALLDIGYSLLRYKNDGDFGPETAQAITEFRADRGITGGEGLDAATLKVLDRTAPPPGQITQHYLDYGRLFADGRLDVTLAIGYDESKGHEKKVELVREWLAARKLSKTAGGEAPKPAAGAGADLEKPAAGQTTEAISVPETWTGVHTVTYPDKDGTRITRDITVSITLVPPGTGGKANFAKGLNESELTLYSGHARRGVGPDFDPDVSPYENFVIGVNSALHKAGRLTSPSLVEQHHYVVDKKNDLEAMKDSNAWDPEKYRVWFFAACTSLAFVDELRGGLLPEKMDRHNLDVFGTSQQIPMSAGLAAVFANIDGVLKAETMEQILENMQRSSLEAFRKNAADKGLTARETEQDIKEFSRQMYIREGAGDNPVAPGP